MKAYFDRHEVDKEGSTWEEQGKGWQAWHGWGGDAGYRWARRIVAQLEKAKGDTARLEGSLDVSPNESSSPVNQEGDQ